MDIFIALVVFSGLGLIAFFLLRDERRRNKRIDKTRVPIVTDKKQSVNTRYGELICAGAIILGLYAYSMDTSRSMMGIAVVDFNAMNTRLCLFVVAGVFAVLGVYLVIKGKEQERNDTGTK